MWLSRTKIWARYVQCVGCGAPGLAERADQIPAHQEGGCSQRALASIKLILTKVLITALCLAQFDENRGHVRGE